MTPPGVPARLKLLQLPTMTPAVRWFLIGTLASNIGNGLHTLTAGLLLYQHTGSVAAFGAVIAFEQAATFLMQVVAGPAIDRGCPRWIAMTAEVLRGGIVCGLSLLLAANPDNLMLLILAMTLVIRLAHPFHRSGIFALAPELVAPGELARLNSWFSGCQQAGQLIGLAATGIVVAHWGASGAFFINGVTFLVSAASLAAIRVRPGAEPAHGARGTRTSRWRSLLADWCEISVLLRRDIRLVGLIVVSAADNVAFFLFNLALAPYAAERLGPIYAWSSVLASAFAMGAMASSIVVSPIAGLLGSRLAIAGGIAGQALCFAALWRADQLPTMVVLVTALGAFNTISWTMALTAFQLEAPAASRGRLAMLRNAAAAVLLAVLVPCAAWIGQHYSPDMTLLVASLVCVLFLPIALLSCSGSPRVSSAGRERSMARPE